MVDHAELKRRFADLRGPRFWTKLDVWMPAGDSRAGRRLAPLRWVASGIPIYLPSGLSFARMRGVLTRSSDVDRWSEVFVDIAPQITDPRIVHATLTAQLPAPNALRVSIGRDKVVTYHLVMNIDAERVAYARRWFCRERRLAYHDLLMVRPDFQGRRIATNVMANAVALYDQLNITRIEITAGLSAGSKVWPRFGFRPVDEEEWAKLRRGIQASRAWAHLSVSARALAEKPLKLKDPRAIWPLARLKDPVTDEPLGELLLSGHRWRGMLDLGDPQARTRLEGYLKKPRRV